MVVNFSTETTKDSVSMPGVSFTYLEMTEALRTQLRIKLMEPMHKVRRLQAEVQLLTEANTVEEGDEVTEEVIDVTARVMAVLDEVTNIQSNDVDPQYFKTCFVKITNFAINGKSKGLDADKLLQSAPEKLVREIMEHIKISSGLTVDEQEDFDSPTTLAAEEDGQTSDTSAAPAKKKDSTKLAIVPPTSPKTSTKKGKTGGTPNMK